MLATFFLGTDRLLRGERWAFGAAPPGRILGTLAIHVTFFGLLYGAVMGTFGGWWGERGWQIAFSALKVPLMLLATFLLALPSFFVLNSVVGLRPDFIRALRALATTQAAVAITLAALAPITGLWYLSCADYNQAILFNGVMFAVASGAGQLLLRSHYQPLIARDPRHRWMLRAWLLVYVFVGIQMGWMLRPFVGQPGAPVEFIRQDTWGNAYVIVAEKLWQAFGR